MTALTGLILGIASILLIRECFNSFVKVKNSYLGYLFTKFSSYGSIAISFFVCSVNLYAWFSEKEFSPGMIYLSLLISASLVLMLDELFWFKIKKISGQSIFSSAKAANFYILDFKIFPDSLSRFPFVLIRAKSETAKQKRTNFESKSLRLVISFLLRVTKIPYVSIKKIP
jgi:hypothetical protein